MRVLGFLQEKVEEGAEVERKGTCSGRHTLHSQNVDLLRRQGNQGMGLLVVMSWIISYDNEWNEYCCYSREGTGVFKS